MSIADLATGFIVYMRQNYAVYFSSFLRHSHVASFFSLSFIQEIRSRSGRSVEIYSQLLKRYLIELAVHELMPVIFSYICGYFHGRNDIPSWYDDWRFVLSGEQGY